MARKTWELAHVRSLRLSRHWSQEKLAEQSGLSTRTIQRIEQGQKVDMASAVLMAEAFDIDVNELLEAEHKPSWAREKKKDTELFRISLVATIVLFVCMLTLALFPQNGDDLWFEFVISTILSLMVLTGIAEKTYGPDVTKRFIKKILG